MPTMTAARTNDKAAPVVRRPYPGRVKAADWLAAAERCFAILEPAERELYHLLTSGEVSWRWLQPPRSIASLESSMAGYASRYSRLQPAERELFTASLNIGRGMTAEIVVEERGYPLVALTFTGDTTPALMNETEARDLAALLVKAVERIEAHFGSSLAGRPRPTAWTPNWPTIGTALPPCFNPSFPSRSGGATCAATRRSESEAESLTQATTTHSRDDERTATMAEIITLRGSRIKMPSLQDPKPLETEAPGLLEKITISPSATAVTIQRWESGASPQCGGCDACQVYRVTRDETLTVCPGNGSSACPSRGFRPRLADLD